MNMKTTVTTFALLGANVMPSPHAMMPLLQGMASGCS